MQVPVVQAARAAPVAPLSLLCLPCAGASATMYHRWRRLLPGWIDIVPMELPGRGARMAERLVEDFDELVALLCAELKTAVRGRFAIFGHSMGGLLAYGMARQLEAASGPRPCALMVSASSAPSRRTPHRFAVHGDDDALIADLRKQGGTPEEVFSHAEILRLTLDVLAADYRVCASFRHREMPPLPLPLHVFGGTRDDIEAERVQAWSAEAAGRFTLDWFDGGHFFLRQHEALVLASLERHLAQA